MAAVVCRADGVETCSFLFQRLRAWNKFLVCMYAYNIWYKYVCLCACVSVYPIWRFVCLCLCLYRVCMLLLLTHEWLYRIRHAN
jgi:hypothetical protein